MNVHLNRIASEHSINATTMPALMKIARAAIQRPPSTGSAIMSAAIQATVINTAVGKEVCMASKMVRHARIASEGS